MRKLCLCLICMALFCGLTGCGAVAENTVPETTAEPTVEETTVPPVVETDEYIEEMELDSDGNTVTTRKYKENNDIQIIKHNSNSLIIHEEWIYGSGVNSAYTYENGVKSGVSTTYPDGRMETGVFQYDSNGCLLSETIIDSNGESAEYIYKNDRLLRMTTKFLDGNNREVINIVEFDSNEKQRFLSIIEEDGSHYDVTFDENEIELTSSSYDANGYLTWYSENVIDAHGNVIHTEHNTVTVTGEKENDDGTIEPIYEYKLQDSIDYQYEYDDKGNLRYKYEFMDDYKRTYELSEPEEKPHEGYYDEVLVREDRLDENGAETGSYTIFEYNEQTKEEIQYEFDDGKLEYILVLYPGGSSALFDEEGNLLENFD